MSSPDAAPNGVVSPNGSPAAGGGVSAAVGSSASSSAASFSSPSSNGPTAVSNPSSRSPEKRAPSGGVASSVSASAALADGAHGPRDDDEDVHAVVGEADRLSIDDISISSVSGGGLGGGVNRRQNSLTSRSSNCSGSFSSAILPPSGASHDHGAAPLATSASSALAASTSVASSSSGVASSFRSLSVSRDGLPTPSTFDVAFHYPSALGAPPSSRTSPMIVPSPSLPPSTPLSSSLPAASCVINLNVGGYTFSTSLSTLVKYEESMLAVMFSGRHPFSKDREGRYFIDRDGQHFGHILSYLRSDALPPEEAVVHVLREAEFFCLQSLIEKLEASSPRVIAIRRREYFRALIPDYDAIKKSIVGVASQKRTAFEESIVVLTQDNHAKLQGSIPCYNCTREPVCVTHDCTFRGNKSDITVKVKTQEINMDKMIGFIVNELVHDGFSVAANVVLCKFSLRCHSCTMSGLYTAGGILAPRECPNMAHLLTFNW